MDHTGDGQPPAEDARPYLPTEIERPYPPAEDARPYLPTEIDRPYPPVEDARPYLPAEDARPYLPTEMDRPYPSTHAGPGEPAVAGPSYTPTHARPANQPSQAGRADPAPEYMRYSPGVPATPPTGAAQTAERIWRTGRLDEPPRRPRRWRGLAGAALTVILLATSAVVLYLRFHHAPFQVTGVAITQRTQSGCGVNVTGEISTNGAAGTVSYQWLFRPDQQAPQPLSQSVIAGQDAVDVTVAVQGSGHGSGSRAVTLQILGPDRRAVSTSVVLRC